MSTVLANFMFGAVFNLCVAIVIVRFIYCSGTREKSYVFTFLAFSTVVYLFMLGLLTSADVSLGVGFGLFAIFSLLRYRTAEIPIREMTYLFVVIALAVLNSILISSGDFIKTLSANGLMVVLLYALERGWGFRFETSKRITYEKIELIKPDERARLLADLRERTGLSIRHVEIGTIDFLHDTAELKIFYDEPRV